MPEHVAIDVGSAGRFPIGWLRDSCGCSLCRHPSGQRLADPALIPADLAVARFELTGDELLITWSPDDHESRYQVSELVAPTAPLRRNVRKWDASVSLPVAEYGDITVDRRALRDWLAEVSVLGVGVVRSVPVEDGAVAQAAELFSFVRETNYGRWFDVQAVIDATNLADTSLGLAAHTDNPYRDPVPTMQLLHCLVSTGTGGDNFVVDGFTVSDRMRTEDPVGFHALATRPARFVYEDRTTSLSNDAPLIELDHRGEVRAVRFNTRSVQPARLLPDESMEDLAVWHRAYVRFAQLLAEPELQVRFHLEPGELFLVDNRRVLHGRTAYGTEHGRRHLQGCYADIDGLRSTLAVLDRESAT
jgi:gamma-butyrobetaine dioxygenase